MARTHINFRTAAALVLLGALIAVFASLGNWQLNRAAQRDALREHQARADAQPPLSITGATPSAKLLAWRKAHTRGRWLHRYTVLIENRNYQTRPGYWVATPLALEDDENKAILVLRGWLPREDVIQTGNGVQEVRADLRARLAQREGVQEVEGELFSHVPRVFELWSWAGGTAGLQQPLGQDATLPLVQNLELEDYAAATGLHMLAAVLAEKSASPALVQDWPRPSVDADTNRGYALQWFSFCAIAAGAFLFLIWRIFRPATPRKDAL